MGVKRPKTCESFVKIGPIEPEICAFKVVTWVPVYIYIVPIYIDR